ncbi:MAG: hypothetical protein ABH873_04465 [Candidatus Firestonebacteria bacterium]
MKLSGIIGRKNKSPEELIGNKNSTNLQENKVIVEKEIISSDDFGYEENKKKGISLYAELIRLAKYLVENDKERQGKLEICEEAQKLSNKVIDELKNENNELLKMSIKSTEDNFLFAHLANVCILSIKMGLGLNFSTDKLTFLGIFALLHHIKSCHVDLINKTIQSKHKDDMINEIKNQLKGKILYNRNIADDEMNDVADVVNLIEVYESLTHYRKSRERKLPHEILKMFIETSSEVFENSLVKVFIEQLSIYPLGSFIKLNSGEIGEVIKTNRNFPTRPVIKIILDKEKKSLEKPKVINLVENPMIQVREAVDEEKLVLNDKRLILKLKLSKWWVE